MYSQDTINQFIQLRAQELSYRKIGEVLKISVGLASQWAHEHADKIEHLTFARREAARERFVPSYEKKLADIADELCQINKELMRRDFDDVSTEFLLYRKTCQQARLEKLAALSSPASPLPLQALEEMNKPEQK